MFLATIPRSTIIILIITAVVVAVTIVLYILGKRAEKKKAEQDEAAAKMAQTISMLIIDKKKMRLKDAGLPDEVVNSMPRIARGSKMPIVKAMVGKRAMTFICDYAIFDQVPVKKEVKAQVSGLYITSVKGLHGAKIEQQEKKKGLRAWLKRKSEGK